MEASVAKIMVQEAEVIIKINLPLMVLILGGVVLDLQVKVVTGSITMLIEVLPTMAISMEEVTDHLIILTP